MKTIGEHVEGLQVGKVKTGWAWWNNLRAKQAAAASNRAAAENAYVQTLVARKAVEHQYEHLDRELDLQYRGRELVHAKAELEYQVSELEYRKLSRQAEYTAALLTFIEQVTEEAASYGRTLPTHQAILKEEAFTELEIERLRAKSDEKIRKIEAKTYSEILLLDKKLEAALSLLDAETRHQIELLVLWAGQELEKIGWETDQQIRLLEKGTELRIIETVTIEVARSKLRIDEMNAETDNRIRESYAASNIRIRESLMAKWGDFEIRRLETELNLRTALIYEHKDYEFLNLSKKALFQLYEERQLLEETSTPGKADKLRLLSTHIEKLEQDFNEQQQRLLQTSTRKNLTGGTEDTDFPGDLR